MIFKLMEEQSEAPIIKVIGVGGGGSNAVTHMYKQGIVGVDFAICNTDAQAMELSPVPVKIQLGPNLTEGRGAGSKPEIGRLACEESLDEIKAFLSNNCKMLFITAGMGGGTGTGAAPVIARAAQEMDILTVGIVTLPFTFEGRTRRTHGHEGLEELKKYVDTLIVISNDKLRQIYGNLSLSQAFAQADNILTTAAKGIAEIITVPGYVNVDFEDVNTVMRGSGVAIMGTAVAEGEKRAKKAVDQALNSQLLEDNNIQGARHILLNITSGTKEVTMEEIFEITEFVQAEAGHDTNLIWGNCFDESLGEKLSVTIIATGFEGVRHAAHKAAQRPQPVRVTLEDEDPSPATTEDEPTGIRQVADLDETDEAKAPVLEFDGIRDAIQKMAEQEMDERERIQERRLREREMARKRHERMARLKTKLSPQVINELEREPAFKRRGVTLEDVEGSETPPTSRWTVSDEDEPRIRQNPYFDDLKD